jgi:hypothetical protein
VTGAGRGVRMERGYGEGRNPMLDRGYIFIARFHVLQRAYKASIYLPRPDDISKDSSLQSKVRVEVKVLYLCTRKPRKESTA